MIMANVYEVRARETKRERERAKKDWKKNEKHRVHIPLQSKWVEKTYSTCVNPVKTGELGVHNTEYSQLESFASREKLNMDLDGEKKEVRAKIISLY